MLQALPAGELSVCDDVANARSSTSTSTSVNTNNDLGCIYTTDVKYNDALEQKTKKSFFLKRQKPLLNSSQTIKKKIKRKDINQMKS